MSIEEQISNIKNEILDKADLIAVSKTRTIQEIKQAYNSGQIKFGENIVKWLSATTRYSKSWVEPDVAKSCFDIFWVILCEILNMSSESSESSC